jgi:hypothetical protein
MAVKLFAINAHPPINYMLSDAMSIFQFRVEDPVSFSDDETVTSE